MRRLAFTNIPSTTIFYRFHQVFSFATRRRETYELVFFKKNTSPRSRKGKEEVKKFSWRRIQNIVERIYIFLDFLKILTLRHCWFFFQNLKFICAMLGVVEAESPFIITYYFVYFVEISVLYKNKWYSSYRDLLTKYLFDGGYLLGKCLSVRGIGVSWKIICVRRLDRPSWKMNFCSMRK